MPIRTSMKITIKLEREGENLLSLRVNSHGKPLPCDIEIIDYDYDPYEVDGADDLATDKDGNTYAQFTYAEGTVTS